MVLNNIDSKQREKILRFFDEKLNINLEEYDEDEISIIVDEVNKMIEQKINIELQKRKFLLAEIQKKMDMLLLVQESDNI